MIDLPAEHSPTGLPKAEACSIQQAKTISGQRNRSAGAEV